MKMTSTVLRGPVAARLRELLEATSTADGLRPIDCADAIAEFYPGHPRSAVGMRAGQLLSKWYRDGLVERQRVGTRTYYRLRLDTRKLEA
jgi:hypothetical protein